MTEELDGIRAEIARLKAEEARVEAQHRKKSGEDYPTGTILQLFSHSSTVLIKQDMIHETDATEDRPATDRPVWISIHGDWSGSSYKDLNAVRKEWGRTSLSKIWVPNL